MSYTTARDRLTVVIEALTPTALGSGLGAAPFRHDKTRRGGASRAFWWELAELETVLPTTTNRQRAGHALVVDYVAISDAEAFDAVVASDYTQLTDALLTVANWDQPTSTLVAVTQGGDVAMRAAVVPTERGAQLRISFEVEVET